jgi:murein hydrolase activator
MYLKNMHANKVFFILLSTCALFVAFPALAQKSKSQLEREKKENLQKIVEAEKILAATENQKNNTIGQLTAINRQIEAHEAVIKSISSEIKILDTEITEIGSIVSALEDDLERLKEEYGAMVYAAYKANSSQNRLIFLFSSKSFHQFWMRLKYMQQYSEARKEQVEQIEFVKEALSKQKAVIVDKKIQKDALLKEEINQNTNLLALKRKQSEIIQQLNTRESELKKELNQRKEALAQLDKLIADLIKKEMEEAAARAAKEKAKAEAAAKKGGTSTGKIPSTPEISMLSSSFEGNKSKIIWPVASGFISHKFGPQPHPVLKGIVVENSGIDIQTNKEEKVRSVFDGKVSVVASIRGLNGVVVIIQHGDYRTVYANLNQAFVKPGQEVKAKDFIGEVYTDKDGISELQFQIWKNNIKLDPQTWLYNK